MPSPAVRDPVMTFHRPIVPATLQGHPEPKEGQGPISRGRRRRRPRPVRSRPPGCVSLRPSRPPVP